MSNPSITTSTSPVGTSPANTNFQLMSERPVSFGKPSSSWRKFKRRFKLKVTVVSAENTTTEMPIILMDENLSAEDRKAREKGLALAAHIEHLYRTDEGFRRWYHEGIDEIKAGNFVTFSEDGWKEK